MKLSWWKALGGFFLAAVLSLPALGNTALPGTLNFIEGQASIGTQPLTSTSVGSAGLQSGQTLTTQNGRAEILLTPGVFLRLDHNSEVTMISPGLTNTELELNHGRAEIEVAEIHKQNNIQVRQDDVTTRLMKTGLYDFAAQPDLVRVFKGEARVNDGDRVVKVKGGQELALNASPKLKAQKFDSGAAKDDFYNWSSLRSSYLSEASANAAQIYINNGWAGPGWYWDPWFAGYTFIPGSGILYSPFGWGFYSPSVIYPFYRGVPIVRSYRGPHPGFYRFHPAAPLPHHHIGVGPAHGFHGPANFGGFHGGVRGGGGFHR